MQTKKYSLIESITNTFVGFVVSLLIQLIIYPTMGIPVTFSQIKLISRMTIMKRNLKSNGGNMKRAGIRSTKLSSRYKL